MKISCCQKKKADSAAGKKRQENMEETLLDFEGKQKYTEQ